jgi:hypothetical protein
MCSAPLARAAFAIIMLELLTGQPPIAVAALHMEEPDLYQEMQQHVDGRPGAGEWPPAVVGRLSAVTERCIAYHARARAAVRDVLEELEDIARAAL